MTDIVTFGEVLAEFMATQRNQDLGQAGQFAGPYPGGAPAIFIDQAAKLGSSAALVSATGDDAFGRMLISRLADNGVDVSAIAILPDQSTANAFVTYHDDGSRDFVFNIANSACAHIRAEQFDAVLAGCKLFHIGCFRALWSVWHSRPSKRSRQPVGVCPSTRISARKCWPVPAFVPP